MRYDTMATFAALFAGWDAALKRFEAAAKGRDATQAFVALFECCNWAVALEDRTRVQWIPEGIPLDFGWRGRVRGSEVMGGVRFARNRVHHQWSDALVLDDGGRRYPRTYPAVYFEWIWRPADELPSGKRDRDEAIYRDRLEGEPARGTLAQLGEAFSFLHRVLTPRTLLAPEP